MSKQTKSCDYCGRKIDKAAVLCPFCFHQVEEIEYTPAMPFGKAPLQKPLSPKDPSEKEE